MFGFVVFFDADNDQVIFTSKKITQSKSNESENIKKVLDAKTKREKKKTKAVHQESDLDKIKNFITTNYPNQEKYQLLKLLTDESIDSLLLMLGNDTDQFIDGIRRFIDFDFTGIKNLIGYFFKSINQ